MTKKLLTPAELRALSTQAVEEILSDIAEKTAAAAVHGQIAIRYALSSAYSTPVRDEVWRRLRAAGFKICVMPCSVVINWAETANGDKSWTGE